MTIGRYLTRFVALFLGRREYVFRSAPRIGRSNVAAAAAAADSVIAVLLRFILTKLTLQFCSTVF